ncbi:MAG: hypothetical protein H0X63_12405 [Flavobacteriales bacterium]|nr:hypothetical protein [Flavobacteriales bacterium]
MNRGREGMEDKENDTLEESNDDIVSEESNAESEIEATTTYITLSENNVLRVDSSVDLGTLLVCVLLFTLIVIQSFKWVSDTLRERRGIKDI